MLNEAQGKISYRDLHSKTLAKLKHGNYDQAPQLEGLDRRFLAPLP